MTWAETRSARAPLRAPADLTTVELRPPRVNPPSALAAISSTDAFDRASHTYGKSYRDVVRGFRGELDAPPDIVAFPRDENEVTRANVVAANIFFVVQRRIANGDAANLQTA